MTALVIAVVRLFCHAIDTATESPGETMTFLFDAPFTPTARPRNGFETAMVKVLSASGVVIEVAVGVARVPAVKWKMRVSPCSPESVPRMVMVLRWPGANAPSSQRPEALGAGFALACLKPNGYCALTTTSLTGAVVLETTVTVNCTGCPDIVSVLPSTDIESGEEANDMA